MHITDIPRIKRSRLFRLGRHALMLAGAASAALGTAFGTANYVYHERSLADATAGNPGSCASAQSYVSVLSPSSSQAVTVRFKVEYQFFTDRVRVYYTTDGSNPGGLFGVGTVGTFVLNGNYDCTFTEAGNTIDIASAVIPAQPPGTVVKYIISAYHSGGGDEIFANSGTCVGCGNFTTAAQATVFSYTVGEGPAIAAQPSAQAVCVGSATSLTVGASGTGPLSYQWYLGESEVAGATSSTLSIANAQAPNAGNYTVVITNLYGAVTSTVAAVTVNPLPTASVNSETICAGGTATLTATTAAANPSYLWAPGGETTASITVTPGATTIYSVTVTDGVTTCAASASGTVTVNPLPTVSVNSETICAGGTATLTATTAAANPSYLWAPGGETTASITVTPGATTVYSVTVTDGVTTCAAGASGTVTVNPLPTVSVNSETICAGGTATLTATTSAANPSYLWAPGGETTASITVTPGATTVYSVTVTDGVTTCAAGASGLVTVNPLPTVSVNSETICAGGTATLTATTAAANPSYLWAPGGETTASITVTPGVTTVYSVTVTDGVTTCAAGASGTVTVNPLPTVSVNSETICAGGTATLTATTSAANPSYLWSPGGETTASITVTPGATTVYSVTVTDSVTTCAAGASGTVTVRPIDVFANTAPVTINDDGAGAPYPSVINVSGLTAAVCKVTVTLNGLSHSFPADVDLLLVAPNGQSVLLASDAGNGGAVTGIDLTFDDAAAGSLPDSGTLASGTFKPTNFGNKVDSFAAPAPGGPYASTLASLSGINPNGAWSLYVVDDESIDAGQIAGGWSVAISTLTPIADLAVSQTTVPQPVATGSNLTITVTVANNGPADAANVVLSDTLPAGVTFVSANSTAGSCSEALGVVTCNIGTLLSGSSANVSITLVAAATGASPNAASVTSSTVDLVAGNNSTSSPITIIEPVSITLELANQTVCVGGNVTLTVAATGGGTVTYQWYHDAALIPTATGPSLAINGAQATDAGTYTVVVANGASASSSSAVVTVNPLPTVAVNSETICAGASATLTATTSAANPSYLWSPGGATTPSITVSPALTTVYSVTVIDGTTTCSAGASGTVTVLPTTTATPLTSVTNLCPGLPVSFTTTAGGTGPFTYVWRLNGNALAETGSTLSIAAVTPADAGTYTVEVSGFCNTVTNSATLSVVLPPTITAHPVNQTTPMGNGAVFSVTASSVVASNIQWQLNGVDIPGATGASITVSNVTLAQSGSAYRAVVSNCGGSATSVAAVLTVTPQFGISFDFNTPNQYSNAPFNLKSNNWMSSAIINGLNNPFIPTVAFEVPTGGVGNSGALDLAFNQGNGQSSTLHPVSFDFSLPGKTLVASAMVKIKAPAANNRNTQIGFTTVTNLDLDNSAGRSYMTVILQSTAQPALSFDVRQGSKVSAANSFIEGNASTVTTLTAAKWYKLTATFINSNAVQAGTYRVSGLLQDMGTDGLGAPTTVATMGPVTITNVDVTSAKNLFLVLRSIENAGADFHDNVYAYSTNGPAYFVQQPASQTIAQGRQITFQAQVNGEGPYTYQWNKNGEAIPGAGSWNYTTPPMLLTDDGSQFTVTVTTPNGSITSDPATITVQAEELNVVSVGSVEGSTIGLRFDQPVERSSAEIAGNYLIDGVPAYAAQLRANGTDVLLSPAAPVSGNFTVTVANVVSLSGTAIGANNSASGTVAGSLATT